MTNGSTADAKFSTTSTHPKTDVQGASLPGISVVIPAYNYSEYLPKAIDSALLQNYPLFEVIVVDDGSTDSTPEIIRAYEGKIRSVRQTNQGLSAARNTGIQAARFPFIALLDADDIWQQGLLLKLALSFQTLPKDTGIVACNTQLIDADGNIIRSAPQLASTQPTKEITWEDLLFKNRLQSSGLLIAQACFQTCGMFDVSLRSSEDRDMWLRIAEHFRVFTIPENLVFIRRHARNMSAHPFRMKTSMLRVISSAFQHKPSSQKRFLFKARVFSYCYYETSWMHYDASQPLRAVFDVLRSFLLYPLPFNRTDLNRPSLFRLRSLARFAAALLPKRAFDQKNQT